MSMSPVLNHQRPRQYSYMKRKYHLEDADKIRTHDVEIIATEGQLITYEQIEQGGATFVQTAMCKEPIELSHPYAAPIDRVLALITVTGKGEPDASRVVGEFGINDIQGMQQRAQKWKLPELFNMMKVSRRSVHICCQAICGERTFASKSLTLC